MHPCTCAVKIFVLDIGRRISIFRIGQRMSSRTAPWVKRSRVGYRDCFGLRQGCGGTNRHRGWPRNDNRLFLWVLSLSSQTAPWVKRSRVGYRDCFGLRQGCGETNRHRGWPRNDNRLFLWVLSLSSRTDPCVKRSHKLTTETAASPFPLLHQCSSWREVESGRWKRTPSSFSILYSAFLPSDLLQLLLFPLGQFEPGVGELLRL